MRQTLETRTLKDNCIALQVVGMMANSGGWHVGSSCPLFACAFAYTIPPPGMPSPLSPSSEPNAVGVVLLCAVRRGSSHCLVSRCNGASRRRVGCAESPGRVWSGYLHSTSYIQFSKPQNSDVNISELSFFKSLSYGGN